MEKFFQISVQISDDRWMDGRMNGQMIDRKMDKINK